MSDKTQLMIHLEIGRMHILTSIPRELQSGKANIRSASHKEINRFSTPKSLHSKNLHKNRLVRVATFEKYFYFYINKKRALNLM